MTLSPRLGPDDRPWISLCNGQQAARARVLTRLRDGTYPLEEVPCFCGDRGGLAIAERDRYGLPVRTVLCTRCGILRTSPRMTAEATARFYEEDYRDLYTGPGNAGALFEQQRARGRGCVQLLGRLVPRNGTVYEIGCGAGGILAAFAEAGASVAGADLGSEYLDRGRDIGLDLINGDARALLQHRGTPADLVLLLHVVEHFLDLEASLADAIATVRPGGFLFVEVPGVASIETSYQGDILRYLQNAHTYHFTGATLRFVLESVGLEVITAADAAFALCRRPIGSRPPAPAPPGDEAQRVLQFLGAQEKALTAKLTRDAA